MNNPWGLSGPQFLWIYVIAFAVALVALIALRRLSHAGSAAQPTHSRLTLDEIAYLSGGWPRMVEAAIAGLVERGTLRVERNGYIYKVTNPKRGPETSLERAIVLNTNGVSGRTPGQIQRKLSTANKDIFEQTHESLRARGLVFGGKRVLAAAIPMGVLFVVGVARWINGVELDYPVGWLSVFLIVTLVVLIFALRPVKPSMTRAGRRVAAEHAPHTDAASLVAKGGLTAYPDQVKAKAFRKKRDTAHASSGGGFVFFGGASSCSGGSSCGGSSSSCGGSSSSSSCGGGGGCGGGGS